MGNGEEEEEEEEEETAIFRKSPLAPLSPFSKSFNFRPISPFAFGERKVGRFICPI